MLMTVGFRKKPVENMKWVSFDPAKQSFIGIFCELGRSRISGAIEQTVDECHNERKLRCGVYQKL